VRIGRGLVGDAPTYGVIADGEFQPLAGDVFSDPVGLDQRIELSEVPLLSPTDPMRTFAVLGGFFAEDEPPTAERPEPMLCPKVVPEVSGDHGRIIYPAFATSVVIEAEMALVIGRRVRGAPPEEAGAAIWGYTCCNDVTAPQYFPQFYLAKGIDTFCSVGPWVRTDLTDEEIRDGLAITARVNGSIVQQGTTGRYKFSPAEMVSYLSTFLTLSPGDVITLGTPPPPPEVQPGDLVEVEVEGIGTLTNHVVPEGEPGP